MRTRAANPGEGQGPLCLWRGEKEQGRSKHDPAIPVDQERPEAGALDAQVAHEEHAHPQNGAVRAGIQVQVCRDVVLPILAGLLFPIAVDRKQDHSDDTDHDP